MWRILTWVAGISIWLFAFLAITYEDAIWLALLMVVLTVIFDCADYVTRRSQRKHNTTQYRH